MTFKTPDLCDEFEADLGKSVRVVAPMFQRYGGRTGFAGRIVTLKLFEDNSLVREAFAGDGKGKVLVVDGGGSLESALVGDLIAASAVENGWAGIIVHGAIRDRTAIGALPLGVKALGSNPRKSAKDGVGEVDVPVEIGGVVFRPGAYVWADADGILVER